MFGLERSRSKPVRLSKIVKVRPAPRLAALKIPTMAKTPKTEKRARPAATTRRASKPTKVTVKAEATPVKTETRASKPAATRTKTETKAAKPKPAKVKAETKPAVKVEDATRKAQSSRISQFGGRDLFSRLQITKALGGNPRAAPLQGPSAARRSTTASSTSTSRPSAPTPSSTARTRGSSGPSSSSPTTRASTRRSNARPARLVISLPLRRSRRPLGLRRELHRDLHRLRRRVLAEGPPWNHLDLLIHDVRKP